MKLHVAAVACVAMCATLALAQSAPAGAGSAPAATAPEPSKKPMSRKQARAVQESADARLCLEFPTQLMIVKCAEKYRLDKRES